MLICRMEANFLFISNLIYDDVIVMHDWLSIVEIL